MSSSVIIDTRDDDGVNNQQDYNEGIQNEEDQNDGGGPGPGGADPEVVFLDDDDEDSHDDDELAVVPDPNPPEHEIGGAGDSLYVRALDAAEELDDNDENGHGEPQAVNIFQDAVTEGILQYLNFDYNRTGLKHFEAIFGYMMMHFLTFMSILTLGLTVVQFVAMLFGTGPQLVTSPYTYLIGLLYILVARACADTFEYKHVDPIYNAEIAGSRVWKHVPFFTATGLAGFAYGKLLAGYEHKFAVLESGDRYSPDDSGWYLISVAYIFYFVCAVGLQDSRPTTFVNQVIQNGLSMVLVEAASRIGGNCAILLLHEGVSQQRVVMCLVASVLFLTGAYVMLYYRLLETVPRQDGSKIVEIIWGLLSSYVLIQLFLAIDVELARTRATQQGHGRDPGEEDVPQKLSQLSGYSFYSAVAFSLSNLSKLVLSRYCLAPGPRPPPLMAMAS